MRATDATAPEAQRSAAAEELAYRSWSTAAELAQQAGATALQVECADALAQLYERQGRWAEASQINRSALALAQTLRLAVIAEGVETQAQRDFLASIGCRCYQDFLFSRPLPLGDFEQLVARR